MPLKSSKEPLYQPSAVISSQVSTILSRLLPPVYFVKRDHIDSLFTKIIFQIVAVICLITNKFFRLNHDHVKFKGQLNQCHFMMVRSMRANSYRKAITVNNSHYFHAFAAFCFANSLAAAFCQCKRGIFKTLRFINITLLAQDVCKLGQNITKYFISAAFLKPTMNCFIVGIALRKHMPLSACVQYPQHSFQYSTSRNRFSSWPIIGNTLFRKVFPEQLSLLVFQSHALYFTPI